MLHVKNLDEGLEIFKALGSELRINIIKLLQENHEMTERGSHGNQKVCKVAVDKIVVDVESEENEEDQNIYNTEVKVGHYSDYDVYPTCGLATSQAIVGEVDDPRYFSHPDRINAGILWFTKGYIEYMIPNLLPSATKIDQITVSLEISSEAPGINNDWPSDISILLNDVKIGTWTSPGDYGDVQGIFTPDWWFPNWNQYGLLKMIVINKKGTFVDGLKISNVTINEFNLDYKSTVRFKFEIEEDAKNVGGITIFGSEFGNYNQDIKVRIAYSPMEIAKK